MRITVGYNTSPLRTLDLDADFLFGADAGSIVRLIVKGSLDLNDAHAFFDLEGAVSVDGDGVVTASLQFSSKETCLPIGSWPGELRIWKDGDDTHPPDDSVSVDFQVDEAVDLP